MTATPADDPAGRWRQLAAIAVGLLLAFAPWFSASAVAPLLAAEWQTTRLELPLLTVAVQLGFAAGALTLAATGAADVSGSLPVCRRRVDRGRSQSRVRADRATGRRGQCRLAVR